MSKKENLFSMLGVDTDVPVWSGMPHHVQNQAEAEYVLCVNLETKEDLHAFADLIGQPQLKNEAKTNLKSTWFPRLSNAASEAQMGTTFGFRMKIFNFTSQSIWL